LILAVYSPKGGVGNTLLTLALAREASKKLKVCAVEFDFTPGDFPSLLDVDRRKNVYSAMNGEIENTVQKPDKEKFDVIPGGYPDIPERFDETSVKSLFTRLTDVYDFIIIDVQPVFCTAIMDAMAVADKILLVSVDDFSIVSRTIGTLDWAKTNNFIDLDKFIQVVNMQTKRNVECVNLTGPKVPVIHTIPYIKSLTSYRDIRLKKHCQHILHYLMPDMFEEPRKKGILNLFRKGVRNEDGEDADGAIETDKQDEDSGLRPDSAGNKA